MLKIEAVIRNTRLQQVKNELAQIGITTFSTFKMDVSGISHGFSSDGKLAVLKPVR